MLYLLHKTDITMTEQQLGNTTQNKHEHRCSRSDVPEVWQPKLTPRVKSGVIIQRD